MQLTKKMVTSAVIEPGQVDSWIVTLSNEMSSLDEVDRCDMETEIHSRLADISREMDEQSFRSDELGILESLAHRIIAVARGEYEKKYHTELLLAIQGNFPNQNAQEAAAEHEAQSEKETLRAIEAFLRIIETQRSDIWKRMQALKVMAECAKAEAWASGRA